MEDKKLDELIELLRKATRGAEGMVASYDGDYISLELLETIDKANAILKELDENKAIIEERLGKEYPMSFSDNALMFRSGNPRPQGSADDIIACAKKFYDELSPETSEFFNTMLDNGLMDLLSTEGKRGGGYCTGLSD